MYENQEIIDKETRKLKEIDPTWSIGSMTLNGNRAISLGITVKIKGNAEKIKRLEADGWQRTFRKKKNGMITDPSMEAVIVHRQCFSA